jgi:hypothetical protein
MEITMLKGVQAATAGELPRLFVLETEYVQALRQAELEYVVALRKDIESGELTGLEEWRSWYAPGGERAEPDPGSDSRGPAHEAPPPASELDTDRSQSSR